MSSVSGNVFRYTAGTTDLSGTDGINEHLATPNSYATTAKGCAAFSLSLEDEDASGILHGSPATMPTTSECKALATTIVAALTHSDINRGETDNQKSLIGQTYSVLGAGTNKRIKKVFLRVVMEDITP